MLVLDYSYWSFNFACISFSCFAVGLHEPASKENLSRKVYLELVGADFDEFLASIGFNWPF